jgi:hypothetical protein
MTEVDRMTVARYYVECELGNIVDCDTISYNERLNSSNLLRILEALSFTYRANSVFDYVASDRYRWKLSEVHIDEIVMTGMSELLTKIIYSDDVQQNVSKFIEYIKNHSDDPVVA